MAILIMQILIMFLRGGFFRPKVTFVFNVTDFAQAK
jgi:hypothetical protein